MLPTKAEQKTTTITIKKNLHTLIKKQKQNNNNNKIGKKLFLKS